MRWLSEVERTLALQKEEERAARYEARKQRALGQPSPTITGAPSRSQTKIEPNLLLESSQNSQFHGSAPSTPEDLPTDLSAADNAPPSSIDANEHPASPRCQQTPPNFMYSTYKCSVPSCTAPPFQTQSLLKYAQPPLSMLWKLTHGSAHVTVHSQLTQSFLYYCPVKNCRRAKGGKGFKRWYEMIWHGLEHKRSGYVCPFCPQREHKYLLPDKLQRSPVLLSLCVID